MTELSMPISSPSGSATRLATRLAFLVAGFALSCWAPLVPYVKLRLGLDEHVLGLLLLCMGLGSVAAMVLTGGLCARIGSKPVIIVSGSALALTVPLLAMAGSPTTLTLALLLFGAFLGSLDVAMNIHAVEVERIEQRPLMSGFHALFSIGGFAGAAVMTVLLSYGVAPLASTLLCAAVIALTMLLVAPRLIRSVPAGSAPLLARPRGLVLILAPLAGITFLVEGAVLDWGALLITQQGLVSVAQGGIGYILFSVAMTVGRLTGDHVTSKLGDRTVLQAGGLLALAGFAVLLLSPGAALALSGFVLIGLGASNIVPVFFRRAAAQKDMPTSLAIAAMTTTGYAGVLLGPATIGFIAQGTGLPAAFWLLAALLATVPLAAHRLAPTTPSSAG